MNPKVRKVVYPVVYSISVIPSILMSPFALLLAPSFRTASLFLVVYNTVWATLFATINGIMTIDKVYLDKAKTLELNGFEKLFMVIMPAAMPSILSGFITSLRGSFVVLVYAEMYGAKYAVMPASFSSDGVITRKRLSPTRTMLTMQKRLLLKVMMQ